MITIAIAGVVVVGASTFAFSDPMADREWAVQPQAATTEQVLVGFTPLHCADGWPSQSIGKQGACSHHGGVVGGNAVYELRTVPAVAGVMAPDRIDWGRVSSRGFWSLLLGGLGGRLVRRRVLAARPVVAWTHKC